MLHGQANVALLLPQADSMDFGTVDEQWDNLSDWLYTDTDNSSKKVWAGGWAGLIAEHVCR